MKGFMLAATNACWQHPIPIIELLHYWLHYWSFKKPTEWYLVHVLNLLWPIFCADKKSDDVDMVYLGKITANVRKKVEACLIRYDENIDHYKKKSSK